MSKRFWEMAKIVLIEDDNALREIVAFNLKKNSHTVFDTENANDALIYMEEVIPDVIIADLMLPGLKGEDFVNIVKSKAKTASVPIIIISAKDGEDKVVELLKSGADDYLTKPFSIKILLSKIDVLLKRTQKNNDRIAYLNVEIDMNSRKVFVDDKEIVLTHTEFELLVFLMKHPKMVFTRNQFLSNIWGYDSEIYTRTVDAHISSLRKKLNNAEFKIKSVPKVGYKIE